MSLLNLYLAAHRALVGVDTAMGLHPDSGAQAWAQTQDRSALPAEVSKLYPIAHSGALLAGRGTIPFFLDVVAGASMVETFDQLEDRMPALLRQVAEIDAARVAAVPLPEHVKFPRREILLVGWSAREGSMVATHYQCEGGAGAPFEAEAIDLLQSPWEAEQGPAVEPRTDHDMLQLARAQVSYARANYPGAPIGGRLIVAEVTRGAVAVREVGQIG